MIDKPVKKVDGTKNVIDLMLSRSVPRNHADELEHLVVELKAPKVKIGAEEITQIEKYAFAVSNDERFKSLNTTWNFWVISNALDEYAEHKVRQKDRPRGLIQEEYNIKIWVKTWADVISECNARLKFLKDKLNVNVDKGSSLKYLTKTYDKYLSASITGRFEADLPLKKMDKALI